MRYDVYDFDDETWACLDDERGYLTGFMTQKQYTKWWFVQYGVMGRRLPGRYTLYRAEADEKEKKRNERSG